MTIRQIIELLNDTETKYIHKIYSIEEGWCYITSRSGARLKLTPDMPNKIIYEVINQVQLNNK